MLKLRQMETHGVHLRGFPSIAGLVGSVQENIFLPWLVQSVRYKRIFSLLVKSVALSPIYTGIVAGQYARLFNILSVGAAPT